MPVLNKPHTAQHQDIFYKCHYFELRINTNIPKCFKCLIEFAKNNVYFNISLSLK